MDVVAASGVHVVPVGVFRAVEGAAGVCRKEREHGGGGVLETLAQVGDAGDVGGCVGRAVRCKWFGPCVDVEIAEVVSLQPFFWVFMTLQVMLHSLRIFSGHVSWGSSRMRDVC